MKCNRLAAEGHESSVKHQIVNLHYPLRGETGEGPVSKKSTNCVLELGGALSCLWGAHHAIPNKLLLHWDPCLSLSYWLRSVYLVIPNQPQAHGTESFPALQAALRGLRLQWADNFQHLQSTENTHIAGAWHPDEIKMAKIL